MIASVFFVAISMISQVLSACPQIFEKWPLECEIHDRYQNVKKSFEDEFSLDVTYLNGYRTLRLISRSMMDEVAANESKKPWEYYPDSPSWQFWERGAATMENIRDHLMAPDGKLHLKHLQKIHKHLIDRKKKLMGKSRFLPGAKPGKLRARYEALPSGILFARDQPDGPLSEETFNYLSNYDLLDHKGDSIVRLIPGRKIQEGYLATLLFLKNSRVEKTVKKKIREFNTSWLALKSGDTSEGLSPVQLAARFQKTLVSIHPFHEGNGRLTRLIEDVVLSSFGLPYAPSGDLTDDLVDPVGLYGEKTQQALLHLVGELEDCLYSHRRSKLTDEPITPMCRTIYHADDSETALQQRNQRTMRLKVLHLLPRDRDHDLGIITANTKQNAAKHARASWTQKLKKGWKSQLSFLKFQKPS